MNAPGGFVSSKKGFTLVEILVALAISTIVIAGIYEAYITLHKTWLQEDIKANMQQQTRVAFDTMVREMLAMGYGSNSKINYASQTKLQFETYMQDNKLYQITYQLSGTSLQRTKQEVIASPPPPVTDLIVKNVLSLSFVYYDKNSTQISVGLTGSDPGSQANRETIRRITVTLQVQSSKPVPDTNPPKYPKMTLKADLYPKNLWENEVSMDTIPPDPVTGVKVRDTLQYGRLKVTWNASTATDLAGYLVRYGASSGFYVYYQDVPASIAGTPPQTVLTGVPLQNYTDPQGFNKMYVVVQAYDNSHNYSTPSTPEVDNDPYYTNYTGFSQSTNDTANNILKPSAPQNFAAYSSVGQITLRWTPMTGNPNVAGYRLYRGKRQFTSFPVYENSTSIVMLAKETETGDGWAGARLNLSDSSYVDRDSKLIGCKRYYYAICAVTYDRTRIYGPARTGDTTGGIYSSAQYSLTSNSPGDNLAPGPPTISTGSMPGWRRVFIQHVPPAVNSDGSPIHDYSYTKLYYTSSIGDPTPGAPQPPDPPMPTTSSPALPKDIEGLGDGIVTKDRTIIFNSLNNDKYPDSASPQLPVNSKFRILAVAYDTCGNASSTSSALALTLATLCGDDPPSFPRWPSCATYPANLWVTAGTTQLDTSNWNTYPASSGMTLNWTDVDKTGNPPPLDPSNPPNTYTCSMDPTADNMIDFEGFNVRISSTPSFSTIGSFADYSASNGDILANWNSFRDIDGLAEGNVYYFCVQTSDCSFWSGTTDNVSPPTSGNSVANAYPSSGVRPGRIILAQPPDNIAGTQGTYHNQVLFYIQNTSAGTLNITTMKFKWLNTAAYLTSMTIGQSPNATTVSVPFGPNTETDITGSWPVNLVATGYGSPSGVIPILLEFENSDGSVNQFDDMRGDTISLEFQFTNNSMGVSGFTTGSINGGNSNSPLQIGVSSGPSINFVDQNKPSNPTQAFAIQSVSTLSALPAGYPQVPGLQKVMIDANVTKPSTETISSVKVNYAFTNTSTVINPSQSVFSSLTTVCSGSDYTTSIPGQNDKGVWYYVQAFTAQGDQDRSPKGSDDYYYYEQLPADPCTETPSPPTSAATGSGGIGTLTWKAPTTYVDGNTIPFSDTLVYDVYRRTITGTYGNTPLASGITTTTYTDTTNNGTTTYVYAIKARNSCTQKVMQSGFSNEVVQCAGGTGCIVYLDAGTVTLNTNWSGTGTCSQVPVALRVFKCASASNGIPGETLFLTITSAEGAETSNLTLHEINDSGIFSFYGTGAADDSIYVTAVDTGSGNSDNIQQATTKTHLTDTLTFSASGCSSATLSVITDPCANTPVPPTISYIGRSSKSITVQCPVVTQNTDGSTANDIAGYQVWYGTGTDLTTYSMAQGLTFTTANGYVTATGSALPNATTIYNFFMKAVDTCGHASDPSAVISNIGKNGTYGTKH